MLGEFITGILILILGYAYPAFECYKIVEKNKVEIEELRFWCQYWILVGILTVFDRIGEVFVSWLPMYAEMKLAFFIYLWHPKTKGTGYVYEALLRPYVSRHETHIDKKIQEMRLRAWDFAIYYWHNCTELGQAKFFEILQYLAGQSSKLSNKKTEKNQKSNQYAPSAPPAPPPPDGFSNLPGTPISGKSKNWGSFISPPSSPSKSSINRAVSEPTKSNLRQVRARSPSEPVIPEEDCLPDSPNAPGTPNDKLLQARLKLRRQKHHH